MEIKYKDLTVDNVFDACNVIDKIGFENMLNSIDSETINALKSNTDKDETLNSDDKRAIGIRIAFNFASIVIKNIGFAKIEICRFIAGCCEWENGSPVTSEDILGMKAPSFVRLIKGLFKREDMGDFFSEVSELLSMGRSDSKN